MADYYLVRQAKGAAWDHSRPRRQQDGWEEHAVFMDGLVEDGFVVLGGPVGEGDGDDAVLVVEAESEEAVRARLAADPWPEEVLYQRSVEPWTIFLRRDG